jgi:hypothetical protein
MATLAEARALFSKAAPEPEPEQAPEPKPGPTVQTVATRLTFDSRKAGMTMREAGEAMRKASELMKKLGPSLARQLSPMMAGPGAAKLLSEARAVAEGKEPR